MSEQAIPRWVTTAAEAMSADAEGLFDQINHYMHRGWGHTEIGDKLSIPGSQRSSLRVYVRDNQGKSIAELAGLLHLAELRSDFEADEQYRQAKRLVLEEAAREDAPPGRRQKSFEILMKTKLKLIELGVARKSEERKGELQDISESVRDMLRDYRSRESDVHDG